MTVCMGTHIDKTESPGLAPGFLFCNRTRGMDGRLEGGQDVGVGA
jgi:hypothetical protein